MWGAVAQWLERATDNRVVAGSNPAEAVWKLWQFPLPHFAPVSFGRDTTSRWSLLSGVYSRGSKRSHQSALEMCTVVDSTTHSNPPTCNKPHTLRDAVTGRNRTFVQILNICCFYVFYFNFKCFTNFSYQPNAFNRGRESA